MTTFINTEQMERAAVTFDNAVDQFMRTANQLDSLTTALTQFSSDVQTLSELLGKYQGNNLEKLVKLMQAAEDRQKAKTQCGPR